MRTAHATGAPTPSNRNRTTLPHVHVHVNVHVAFVRRAPRTRRAARWKGVGGACRAQLQLPPSATYPATPPPSLRRLVVVVVVVVDDGVLHLLRLGLLLAPVAPQEWVAGRAHLGRKGLGTCSTGEG